MSTSVNHELNKLLKNPPSFSTPAPTSTAGGVPTSSSISSIDFSQVHLESTAETPSATGKAHEREERKLGREKSVLMKELGKTELRREKLKVALRDAKKSNDEKKVNKYKTELDELTLKKRRMTRRIERLGSDESSDTSSSDDRQDISSPYKSPAKSAAELRKKIEDANNDIQRELAAGNEKKADKIRQEVFELQNELSRIAPRANRETSSRPPVKPANAEKTSSDAKATTQDLISISNILRKEKQAILRKKKDELADLKRDNDGSEKINKCNRDIREIEHEIKILDDLLGQISSAPPAIDSSVMSTLTRRGHRPTQLPLPTDSTSTAKINDQVSGNRRSSLLLGDSMKNYFSKEGIEELEAIEGEIEELVKKFDSCAAKAAKWKKDAEEASHSHDREDFEDGLKNIDENTHLITLKLAKLIEKRQQLEALVFPQQSRKQQNEDREKFLNQFKSDNTKILGETRKKKLADLEEKVRADCGSSAMYYVSGLAAFGTSFFVGNALSRIPYLGSAVVGSFVSSFLHVTVAGPMLKQLLAKTWNAPALVEFNNNVKLHGARWGDEDRDELNVKKYDSKSPNRPGKLTIDERLAEERDFEKILWDRWKSEDASYFFYMLNYLGKAAVVSGAASYFAAGGMTAIFLELLLHSALGAMSGAETVAGIQHTRSTDPASELKATPTREIFAAEVDEQESWLADLKRALSNWQAKPHKDPNDPTGVELIKEIGRTQRALEAARTKSEFGGTFLYEFESQFKAGDPRNDTTSEVLGRWISVLPSAIASELTRSMRKSRDPLDMFLGHAIPAALLIFPPGFSCRALYSGLIRALIQQSVNGQAGHLVADASGQPVEEVGFTGIPTEYDQGRQDWM
jgi:hypothetical protein